MYEYDSDRVIDELRARIADLELERRLRAGRRRIVARTLSEAGFSYRQIGLLLGVSTSQAHKDVHG